MATSDVGDGAYGGNSGIAEDVYNRASSNSGGGITRDIKREPAPIGYRRPVADRRLIRFDRTDARSKPPVSWEATRDDRMSAEQAGDKMQDLYVAYGLQGASPELLEAFHCAIYFSHTLNSASVLQPGRADIILDGNKMPYSLARDVLGVDSRRFFRAYANEVRDNNLRVLAAAKQTNDIVAQEKAAWLREVAESRGLSRYPELAHDTSDCVWNLSDSERAALSASKNMVFSAGVNMADRNRFRPGQSGASAAGSMIELPTAQGNALAAH